MKVSVVIPNYNGLRVLKDCLESLNSQSFKDFDIIIIDNDSKDGSKEYILNQYPDINLVTLNQNYGFSKAVNEGIKASTTQYVILLNNDTEVEEDWLSKLVESISRDDKIFSVSSKMIRYNEREIIDDAGDEYTILGWAYKIGDGKDIKNYTKNKRVFSSCAGAAIYRREVFEQIGYFDENFFAYMEDIDISYRANIYGYKNIYCSSALVYHVGSATSGSKYNSFKVKLAARNNVYVTYKNMPLLQLLMNSPFLLFGWIIKYAFFYKRGFSKEYLDGTLDAVKNIKNIKKVKFRFKNFFSYLEIEIRLILNAFKYIYNKIK